MAFATGTALALLPVFIALVLAFITEDATLSLFVGCLVGVVLLGSDPATGMAQLFQTALSGEFFVWIVMIEVFIGVLIAYFRKAGITQRFAEVLSDSIDTPRKAESATWGIGLFVFFSDYFSPLLAGPVMRPITDDQNVSREKLAYLLDSAAAAVPTLLPITGWAVFIAGLLAEQSAIANEAEALSIFANSIVYNFYGWGAVLLAGLVAVHVVPSYGPMKQAEQRARETGKVIADDAEPLQSVELEQIEPPKGMTGSLLYHLAIPVAIILTITVGTFFIINDTKILAGFLTAVVYLGLVLRWQGYVSDLNELVDIGIDGIKGVLPAIIILSLAYCINSVTTQLNAPEYVISVVGGWIGPTTLIVITFVVTAFVAFFTGTAWGTYAIMTPIAVPLAFDVSGGTTNPIVYMTVAAIVGGGLFGDHSSPLSDTTILSSFGAASDHMAHVKTQIPYALTAGVFALVMYVILSLVIVA